MKSSLGIANKMVLYIIVNQQRGRQNCNSFGYFLELYIIFFVGGLFDV